MKFLLVFMSICLFIAGLPAQAAELQNHAYVLEINGVISPATADYFERSLDKIDQANTELIVLTLDTPGGLDLSMRKIIKRIIASPVPIISYVSPSGSRAASAGTYILYASHIAAMAPATNLGAATPVQMIPSTLPDSDKPSSNDKTDNNDSAAPLSDAMPHKMINDAVAYIRGLAKLRGRNEQWAEQAVRSAVSLPAEDALQQHVIDIVATDQSDLFRQLDGRTVTVLGMEKTLDTSQLVVIPIAPDWRNRVLDVITNPNIAYILMLVGIYGLIFEFSSPGSVLPGTIGSICLLLALFSFQVLPINYAGLALILLGMALMIAEAFQPSFGILGLGGIVAFVAGSVMLIDTDFPSYDINIGLIAGFAFTTALFFILALGLVFKSRRHPVVSGMEGMIGAECDVLEGFDNQGLVRVHSEIWNARTNTPLKKGDKARVNAIHGLILDVAPDITQEE